MRAIPFILAAFIFCGALVISCETTQKEEEYLILSGRVTEADTTIYLSGVIVKDGNNASIVDTTDDRGYFQLRKIAKEKHTIHLEKEGYKPIEYEVFYEGKLARPLISRHVIMEKAQE